MQLGLKPLASSLLLLTAATTAQAATAPPAAPPSSADTYSPAGPQAPVTREQRAAGDRAYFQAQFQAKNLQLEPFALGEGPEQVLSRMNADGKLAKVPWTPERVHFEAHRISHRDLRGEKTSYRVGEQTPLWSVGEIHARVQDLVSRPKGVDVSRYDGDIRWTELKAGGIDFAFIKASGAKRSGEIAVDPKLEQNQHNSAEAGVPVGYYHYFRPDAPVDSQAQTFSDAVRSGPHSSLPLVIDVEEDDVKPMWNLAPDGHAYTPKERVDMIESFTSGVRARLGPQNHVKIALYTNPKFARENLGNDPRLAKYPLWNAHWNTPEATTPAPWKHTSFWQYSGDKAHVNGIDKPVGQGVDLDMVLDPRFRGGPQGN